MLAYPVAGFLRHFNKNNLLTERAHTVADTSKMLLIIGYNCKPMHVLKQLLNYLCIVLKTNLPSSENFCLLQARGGSFTAALQSSLLLLRRGALRSGRPCATKAGKPHPTHPAHVPQGPATPQPAPPPKGQHHAPAPAQPEASQLLRHPHHYSSSSSSSTSIL